jgi:hypothetical protein
LRRIGENAFRTVQAHGWPLIVKQFESILNEAINLPLPTLACRDSSTGVRL